VIGRTVDESSPAWPAPVRAKQGAPNVVYIVLDDTGFGQLGCFGSPIQTPNLDGIAANGLRYNNMHTTAVCSPSRSCILTGRNHHANGMAAITELASGYPGCKRLRERQCVRVWCSGGYGSSCRAAGRHPCTMRRAEEPRILVLTPRYRGPDARPRPARPAPSTALGRV
jgi:hypothetical protein